MTETTQTNEATNGQPRLTAELAALPHDIGRCVGYSYHHNKCGKRYDCRRYNERNSGGLMTNFFMAPDSCADGCVYLIPEPHH